MFEYTVRSECTALLNRKHGRFGRIRALASAMRCTNYLLSRAQVFWIAYRKFGKLIRDGV